MRTRVVVTGMGVLTPIGLGVAEFSRGLREGRDGIAPVTGFETGRHRCRAAGELKGFTPEAPPRDAAWGERYFHLTDPDGHALSFARPLRGADR